MKRRKWLVLLLVLLFFIGGCSKKKDKTQDTLTVVASFYPVYDLVSKIGGAYVTVHNLVGQQEAHDYDLRAQDRALLEDADLIVINGLGMETWVEDLQQVITDSDRWLDLSVGITPLNGSDEHEHEHEASETAHEESTYDPHIWMSLSNVKVELATIRDRLSQLDPDHADVYTSNYDQTAAKADALIREYTEIFNRKSEKEFVVNHAAFGYLAQEFGLTQLALGSVQDEASPTAQEIANMIETIRTHQLTTVFTLSSLSDRVAQTINESVSVSIVPLYNMESLTDAQISNEDDYFSLMAYDLSVLAASMRN